MRRDVRGRKGPPGKILATGLVLTGMVIGSDCRSEPIKNSLKAVITRTQPRRPPMHRPTYP